jgi:hypothetical protein
MGLASLSLRHTGRAFGLMGHGAAGCSRSVRVVTTHNLKEKPAVGAQIAPLCGRGAVLILFL